MIDKVPAVGRVNNTSKPFPYRETWRSALVFVACVFGEGLLSERLGQDANYDLASYHLYNGGALLSGRFGRDLLAADMQSGFNPLLDAIYAAAALGPLKDAPRLLAAFMGLWAGLTAYVAWRLALRLYPGRVRLALIGFAFAVSSAPFVAEVGTTFNDIPVAGLMIAGLLVIVGAPRHWAKIAWAGALFGAAAGLKLTALIYAPAGCIALACLGVTWRSAMRAGAIFTAGWLLGWLLMDGWWALKLWRLYQSPIFPMENGVFRSPWYPPANFIDDRFKPENIFQALIYPLYWYVWKPQAVGELWMRDPIGAVALVLGVAAFIRWRPARLSGHGALLMFLVIGYICWLWTSGIMRYALVLEIVSALCIPHLLTKILQGRVLALGLVATITLVAGSTQYGSWGRAPYGGQAFAAETDWVRPGMLIVLSLHIPAAGLVPLMPFQKQISVIGLDFALLDARGWGLHDEAVRRVREHRGPIAVITAEDASGRYAELGEIGLNPVLTGCRNIQNSFYGPNKVMVCEGKRLDSPAMPSPFWRQAATRYRAVQMLELGTGPLIGAAYLRAAGPMARGTHFLDWTDLLWNGVGRSHDTIPARLDPDTLYVLADDFVAPLRNRMKTSQDALGVVDGVTVLAPGWKTCSECNPIAPDSP